MKRRAFVQSSFLAAGASLAGVRPLHAWYRLSQQAPDVDAVTGDGRAVTLKGTEIAKLATRLRGRLLLAKDPDYATARLILNPSFDKRPALIVQPTGTADVRSAVMFARENNLLVAVKCGGHSFSGQSTCDKGMMIDLSHFRGVRVDPTARRAWVAGGTLLGQVDHETLPHGLVTTLGTVSHTGVGGLTTGGGFGRVGRRFGLAVDNVMSADIVTADGNLVHASATENPDLYWGVRGGGGNFGVVTMFEFQLHPFLRQVMAGDLVFPLARAKDLLGVFAEYSATAPDDLYLDPYVVQPPGGAPGVAGINVCYSGPAAGFERAIAPFRALGTPLANEIKAMDYQDVQKSGDMKDPRARAVYLKGGFIRDFPPALVTAIVDGFRGDPTRTTAFFMQIGGGAVGRVANNATAFSHRYVRANMLCAVDWKTGDDGSAHIAWIKQYWSTLEKYTHGFYVNDMDPAATASEVNANYRENYTRLATIKAKYDPTNLFRLNANVTPKG